MGKINQIPLARAIGISQGHLSAILTGRVPVGDAVAFKLSLFAGRRWQWWKRADAATIRAALYRAYLKRRDTKCKSGQR